VAPDGGLPVQGVQHFDRDQDGEGHGHGMRIIEDIAIDIGPFCTTSAALKVILLKARGQCFRCSDETDFSSIECHAARSHSLGGEKGDIYA
jgi:hypothetical protein